MKRHYVLSGRPLVVSVPPTGDRYFVIQLVDMGTDNFAYIGTRATERDGGDFLLVGPRFKGPVDADRFTQVIQCPSDFVALATRTAIDGAEDLPGVIALQDQLAVRPQSAFSGLDEPAAVAAIDWPAYSGDVYGSPKLFELLNFLLPFHVPAEYEREVLDRISRIGVGPHRVFDLDAFDAEVAAAITEGAADAHAAIEARGNSLGTVVEGWQEIPPMGTYGDNYLFRAAVAWKFIYTNSPEEALYPIAETDADGNPLSGEHDYVIHFDADRLPPVDAFWSITLYDSATRLMIDNPINRYSIGDRTPGLHHHDDGSLTIHLRHHPPQGPDDANWLPAPAGRFYLNTRAYMPRPEFLDGTYRLPPVERRDHQTETSDTR
jgi:hypothetical protein